MSRVTPSRGMGATLRMVRVVEEGVGDWETWGLVGAGWGWLRRRWTWGRQEVTRRSARGAPWEVARELSGNSLGVWGVLGQPDELPVESGSFPRHFRRAPGSSEPAICPVAWASKPGRIGRCPLPSWRGPARSGVWGLRGPAASPPSGPLGGSRDWGASTPGGFSRETLALRGGGALRSLVRVAGASRGDAGLHQSPATMWPACPNRDVVTPQMSPFPGLTGFVINFSPNAPLAPAPPPGATDIFPYD